MTGIHRRMVFEAVQANELHQFLQLQYLNHGASSESIQRIICEKAVSEISADLA